MQDNAGVPLVLLVLFDALDAKKLAATGPSRLQPRIVFQILSEGSGTMVRASYLAIALICFSSAHARADNFTFSFTNSTGTIAGTVTGEVFGIEDNSISSATEVLITSFPAALGVITDLDATDWVDQYFNTFDEQSGALSAPMVEYLADDEGSPPYEPLLSLGPTIQGSLVTDQGEVAGVLTFTPVPEPAAWMLLLTVILAAAIVKRSRRTDGLTDQ